MVPQLLLIMMGLPRSGKTTWAKAEAHVLNAVIVSPDCIRLSLHGKPYIHSMEPYVWSIARTMVESLFHAGHEAVILDATMTTKRARDKWEDMDPVWHYIDTPCRTCVERAMGTDSKYLVPVIEDMAKHFEPLGDGEFTYNTDYGKPI